MVKNFMNVYVLVILLVATGVPGFSNSAFADMEAKLATSDGSDAFVIQNSSGLQLMSIFSDGNVGIGTTSPGATLDIAALNPHMRLTTEGGTNRQWDIWAYSTDGSFRIRDVTAGNADRLVIDSDGNVGIGTISPTHALHVKSAINLEEASGRDFTMEYTSYPEIIFKEHSGGKELRYLSADNTQIGKWKFSTPGGGPGPGLVVGDTTASPPSQGLLVVGNVGIGTTSPNHPLEMGSGAHVTSGGVWTNASSREYKENIRDLTVDEAMQALDELRPSRFNYKVDNDDEYVGFIAEDVPELVATKDRKGLSPMDITAVLTKVAQEQQNQLIQQQNRLLMQEEMLQKQGEMLQKQQDNMYEMKHELEMLKSSKSQTKKGA